jgi:hypothetical protein
VGGHGSFSAAQGSNQLREVGSLVAGASLFMGRARGRCSIWFLEPAQNESRLFADSEPAMRCDVRQLEHAAQLDANPAPS